MYWSIRDYLIKHRDALKQYENLKKELAEKFEFDREAYTDGKSEFIQGIVKKAKEEM